MESQALSEAAAGAAGRGPRRSSQRGVLWGLSVGLLGGIAANLLTSKGGPAAGMREPLLSAVREVVQPAGTLFLRLLFMTVVPLVFSSLALGVHELGDSRQLGRIGAKMLALTIFLSAVSVAIGLLLVNWIEPGGRFSPEARGGLLTLAAADQKPVQEAGQAGGQPLLESIVQAVIPRNPLEAAVRAFDGEMLALMTFALLFGLGLQASGSRRAEAVAPILGGIYDVSMWLIGLALKLAPIGVAALVFAMAARMGLPLLVTLGGYVLTVILGLALHLFGVYSAVLKAAGVSPILFFLRVREVMVTAFSTSSSNATLPTSLRVSASGLGIPGRIGNFVLTLGSTFNQNGTALYEGVTVLFIAQLYGLHLGLDRQVLVVGMSILAGVGTAGVPGGSLAMMVPVLLSVGLPAEGIAVILGVDRLLDMCRTVLNVTGDMVVAVCIARSEGALAIPPPPGSLARPEKEAARRTVP
jgi:DAACS family dicarboxylate/amino acid:cation (Na+ or H+) symporter